MKQPNKSEIRQIPPEGAGPYKQPPVGLSGYWWETEHQICVPVIASAHPGDGTFGKWLRELEAKGKIVIFPTVISARLDRILRARGYITAWAELSEQEKEMWGQDYIECLALFPE